MTFQQKLDEILANLDNRMPQPVTQNEAKARMQNLIDSRQSIIYLIESDVIGEYEQFKSIPGSFRTDIRNKLRSEQRSIIREETKDE